MPEGTCRLGMGRMLDHQPWVSHVEEHMQDLLELWRRRSIRRFYMLLWLSDGAGTHSDGGKSSRTSGWSTLCDNRMRMLILNNFRTVEVPLWPPCF